MGNYINQKYIYAIVLLLNDDDEDDDDKNDDDDIDIGKYCTSDVNLSVGNNLSTNRGYKAYIS
jgi:hypothetical protein